jgi:hypothetical protein
MTIDEAALAASCLAALPEVRAEQTPLRHFGQ